MSSCSLDRDEPELINTLRAHRTTINCVVQTADDKKVISGSDDGHVIFWNLEGDSPTETGFCYRLTGHTASVNSISAAPNGSFFCSASRDTTVRLWKLNAQQNKPNEESVSYKCHGLTVRYVDINTQSSHFCTASDDKTVKVWDAQHRNKFLCSLIGHNNWVRCAKFCPRQSNLIASTGDDGLILVHDLRCSPKQFPIHTLSGSRGKRSVAHFSHLDWYPLSDFLLAVGSSDASVRLYDLRQSNLVQFYESHEGPVTSLSFHPNGKYLISSSSDSLLKIYDLLEGRVLFTIQAHSGAARSVQFNSNGEYFVSGGNDKIVYIWKSNLMVDGPTDVNENDGERAKKFSSGITESILASASPATRAATVCSPTTVPKHVIDHNGFGDVGRRMNVTSPRLRKSTSSPNVSPLVDKYRQKGKASPELSLLEGIVQRITDLTETVSLLEERLAVVESKIDSRR